MKLFLNFYSRCIVIDTSVIDIIEKLKEEFHFFVSDEQEKVFTTIIPKLSVPCEMPSLVAVKVLETSVIYRMGQKQYIDYFGKALTIWDSENKEMEIYSEDQDRLFELCYLAVHSLIGQELDLSGLCRIHAVGVSVGKTNAVVMLPSKGGKSTLLTHLLENPEIEIISDDIPLVSLRGEVYAFPTKLSLDEKPSSGLLSTLKWHKFSRTYYPPKWVASLSSLKDRISPHPEDNKTLLILGHRLSSGNSLLSPVPKWKMIMPLFEHMIIGLGLPQILEYFLKFHFTDIFKLIVHGIFRSIAAFQLLIKSKCFYFYMGPDKTYNAQYLLDLLHEQQE